MDKYRVVEYKNRYDTSTYKVYKRFLLFFWKPLHHCWYLDTSYIYFDHEFYNYEEAVEYAEAYKGCGDFRYKGRKILLVRPGVYAVSAYKFGDHVRYYRIGSVEECIAYIDKINDNENNYPKTVCTL